MSEITYREALNQALREEMERDDRVFLMGEEVGVYQGAYKVSKGLLQQFGPLRVVDTPITEPAFVGVGIGAAMVGLRPVIEVMTFNFAILALDQIINHAAKIRFMSGGQVAVPLVIRGPGGGAHQLAAQHSHSLEALFAHIPGLKVVMPATPKDVKGLFKAAVRDDNPVIFIEGELLYPVRGQVPEEEYVIPIGKGEVKRSGKDVTMIAYSKMLHLVMAVADDLSKEGIEAEVVDPRTIRPLDSDLLVGSVRKTGRCVIVEEGWRFCGIGAEISSILYGCCFDELDAPIERVTGLDVPMPYARNLEKAVVPSKERVVRAVRRALYLKE